MHGQMRPYDPFWTPLEFFILLFLCMVKVAWADEPCVLSPDGTQVVCEKAGFDRAVGKCSDAMSGLADCQVRRDAALKAWAELKPLYTQCATDLKLAQEKPNPTKAIVGYIMGLAGLGAVVLSPTLNTSTEVKWSVGISGVLMVASGLWAVLP